MSVKDTFTERETAEGRQEAREWTHGPGETSRIEDQQGSQCGLSRASEDKREEAVWRMGPCGGGCYYSPYFKMRKQTQEPVGQLVCSGARVHLACSLTVDSNPGRGQHAPDCSSPSVLEVAKACWLSRLVAPSKEPLEIWSRGHL